MLGDNTHVTESVEHVICDNMLVTRIILDSNFVEFITSHMSKIAFELVSVTPTRIRANATHIFILSLTLTTTMAGVSTTITTERCGTWVSATIICDMFQRQ